MLNHISASVSNKRFPSRVSLLNRPCRGFNSGQKCVPVCAYCFALLCDFVNQSIDLGFSGRISYPLSMILLRVGKTSRPHRGILPLLIADRGGDSFHPYDIFLSLATFLISCFPSSVRFPVFRSCKRLCATRDNAMRFQSTNAYSG